MNNKLTWAALKHGRHDSLIASLEKVAFKRVMGFFVCGGGHLGLSLTKIM